MNTKQIQWFPGHMFKSLREIREKIKMMDIVLILLDARLPYASMNPELKKITQNKHTLLLFNKMDLSDKAILNRWISHYQTLGYHTMKIDAQSGRNVQKIYPMVKNILKDQLAKTEAKGLKQRPFRTMILGIPNVGKSTLINQLSKAQATKTANTPGVTKAQQWIKLSEHFELLDTPGVLWPKFDDPKVGYHLAITGAIKDLVLPSDDVVRYALSFLKTYYPDRLISRYQVDPSLDNQTLLDEIGKKRGCFIKGGAIDYDRVYQIILTDLRNKHLGGLSFDRLEHASL